MTEPRFGRGPRLKPETERLAEAEDSLLWAINRIQKVDNHLFDVKESPYLVDIFQDETPTVVIQKSAQIRISITAIIRFLQRVAARGWNGIYYFPTDDAMYPFVQSRFNPMIDGNPKLSEIVRDTNSVSVKNLGSAYAYLFGLRSKSNRDSYPADCETFDELDQMPEKDVEIALERMSASKIHRVDFLSTPSIPGIGINRKYRLSDQKHWVMKCGHCGRQNIPPSEPDDTGDEIMLFPDCIEQGFLTCRKCHLPLDRRVGYWVPKYPGREWSGYHGSRLFAPNANLVKLYQDYLTGLSRENVYNRGLGMAFADTESRVTAEQVLALCGGSPMPRSSLESCTAGIDVGEDYLCVVISRKSSVKLREYIYIGTIKGKGMDMWTRLRDVLNLYNVRKYVIDAMPQTSPARELIKTLYRHDGWLCRYSKTANAPNWNDAESIVSCDRTSSLDTSHKLIRDSLIILPRRGPDVESFASHCENLQRKRDTDDKTGEVTYSWVHSESDPDHYRHAFNYDALCWYQGQGLPIGSSMVVPSKIDKAGRPI